MKMTILLKILGTLIEIFFNDISKKNTFLKLSSNYFRKALKANESKLNQLNLIYNQALIGQQKKS